MTGLRSVLLSVPPGWVLQHKQKSIDKTRTISIVLFLLNSIPEVLSCQGYMRNYDEQLRNKVKLLFENLKIILKIKLTNYSDNIL